MIPARRLRPATPILAALLLAAMAGGCGRKGGTRPGGDAGTRPGGDAMDTTPRRLSANLELPATLPAAGGALPIVVRFADAATGERAGLVGTMMLRASGGVDLGPAAELAVRRDLGSVTARLGATARSFTVGLAGLPDTAPVALEPATIQPVEVAIVEEPDWQEQEGTLSGQDLRWGPDAFIDITGDVRVPEGATLTIAAGTRVRIADEANIDVDGDLMVAGTAEAPVVFEPAGTAWGGLRHRGEAHYRHALIVGGGADASRAFGHSDSQAVIHAEPGARVALDHVAIQDAPGKAMGAEEAMFVIKDSVIARTDTGGEFAHSEVHIARSHFFDFPDRDAPVADDDNDALYLDGILTRDGVPAVSTVEDSVFLHGLDDGIDHSGAVVEVQRSWFEGFLNEGIACSEGGRLHVRDSVLTGNAQGLEAGFGAPEVIAEHVLITANHVGVRYGDSYEDVYEGTLRVIDSIIAFNREHAVWNHLLSTGGPKEDAVLVDLSLVSGPARPEDLGAGVVLAEPVLGPGGLLAPDSPGRGQAGDGGDMGLLTAQPTLRIE